MSFSGGTERHGRRYHSIHKIIAINQEVADFFAAKDMSAQQYAGPLFSIIGWWDYFEPSTILLADCKSFEYLSAKGISCWMAVCH